MDHTPRKLMVLPLSIRLVGIHEKRPSSDRMDIPRHIIGNVKYTPK